MNIDGCERLITRGDDTFFQFTFVIGSNGYVFFRDEEIKKIRVLLPPSYSRCQSLLYFVQYSTEHICLDPLGVNRM